MKSIWLRDEEKKLRQRAAVKSPKRPLTAPERAPSKHRVNEEVCSRKQLLQAKRLLEGVMRRDCTKSDGVAKPANHIVREIEKKQKSCVIKRSKTFKRYNFLTKDFISFGTYDVYNRPDWNSHSDDQHSTQREKLKRTREKLAELNAITATAREVISTYSRGKRVYICNDIPFLVPVYLNNHEIHAWRTAQNLLDLHSRSVSQSHLEELASICGVEDSDGSDPLKDKERVRCEHPEVYHFVCYCNLLLGGTQSFLSAKYLLLRDIAALLKFIQQVHMTYFLCYNIWF